MNYMLLEGCENTDNGLKDADGFECDTYYGYEGICGRFDGNEGFVANQMCCACGGGKTSVDSGKF